MKSPNLLNLVEVVRRILVQDELADLAKWERTMLPDFGNIKRDMMPFSRHCLSGRHCLLQWVSNVNTCTS